ncbi:MAG: hypothetical protein OEW60_04915 [Thiovulaceae bacterium]|nr:hypothetical protein [Sulfurimonadaceae bacterium]
MSIKDDMSSIKDELNSEEKFFEKIIKLEFLYKKYRYAIIGGLIALILYFVVTAVLDAQNSSRITDANKAFASLMESGDSDEQRKLLKKHSRELYDLYLYQKAVKDADLSALESLKKSKAFGIADMAKYEHAILSNDGKALQKYIDKKGLYFRDIAILKKASALLKQSEIKKAHKLLGEIDQRSPLFEQAQLLAHFGIVKK